MKKIFCGKTLLILLAISAAFYAIIKAVGTDNIMLAFPAIVTSALAICFTPIFFHALLTENKDYPSVKRLFWITSLASIAVGTCTIMGIFAFGKNGASDLVILPMLYISAAAFINAFVFLALIWSYQGELGRDYHTDIRIFVISDIFLGLASSAIALASVIAGEAAYLLAAVLLMTYIPASILTLIGALIYYIKKSKTPSNQQN